jgi:hypothetical protein
MLTQRVCSSVARNGWFRPDAYLRAVADAVRRPGCLLVRKGFFSVAAPECQSLRIGLYGL